VLQTLIEALTPTRPCSSVLSACGAWCLIW